MQAAPRDPKKQQWSEVKVFDFWSGQLWYHGCGFPQNEEHQQQRYVSQSCLDALTPHLAGSPLQRCRLGF